MPCALELVKLILIVREDMSVMIEAINEHPHLRLSYSYLP